MASLPSQAADFRALHVPGRPLLMPNPFDAGSAKILASLGFRALATTSSGHAATQGRSQVASVFTRVTGAALPKA